jgi:hypothetical protein
MSNPSEHPDQVHVLPEVLVDLFLSLDQGQSGNRGTGLKREAMVAPQLSC